MQVHLNLSDISQGLNVFLMRLQPKQLCKWELAGFDSPEPQHICTERAC